MRFCQHCGRFQPLVEFKNKNKSCTRSLELHRARQNRRYHSNKGRKRGDCMTAKTSVAEHSDSDQQASDKNHYRENAGESSSAPLSEASIPKPVSPVLPAIESEAEPCPDVKMASNSTLMSWQSPEEEVFERPGEMQDWLPTLAPTSYTGQLLTALPAAPAVPALPDILHPSEWSAYQGAAGSKDDSLPMTLAAALDMLSSSTQSGPLFDPCTSAITRISFKLFNSSPELLPPSLRSALEHIITEHQVKLGCLLCYQILAIVVRAKQAHA